jgi:hypothetical protein
MHLTARVAKEREKHDCYVLQVAKVVDVVVLCSITRVVSA